MAHRIYSRLARFLIRHPLLIVAVLLTVTAFAAVLATRVRHDFSVRGMFSGNGQLVQDAETAKETFGHDAALLVVLEATGRRDVLDKEALTWQTLAARRLTELPQVDEVRGVPTLREQRVQLGWPPQRVSDPLVGSVPADDGTEARVRSFFERHEMAEGTLLSRDRTVAALMVAFAPGDHSLDASRRRVDAVRAALDGIPLPQGYRHHLSGLPVLRVDIVNNLQADQSTLIPLAGLIYLVVLALMLRRVSGSIMLLAVVGMGMTWTLAGMVIAGEPFNLVSNVLPMLLLILGVANGVHVMSRYAEEVAHRRGGRRAAALRTMTHLGSACLLTFLTTVIGFGSLWAAQADVLQSFATQATIGLGCLYVAMIVALGVLLPLFRPPGLTESACSSPAASGPPGGGERGGGLLQRGLDAVTRAVVRHPVATLAASGAVIVGSLWAAQGVQVNSYTIETYDESHPTRRTMRLVEDKLGGMLPLNIVLTADRPGQFLTPQAARQVAAFQEFAARQPEVLFARSYVDLHRGVDERFSEPSDAPWPPLGAEGRHRMQRSEQYLQGVADEIHYESLLTADGAQARLPMRIRDVGTRDVLRLVDRLDAELASLFPAEGGISALITGDAYVNARAMDTMIRDLFWSLATAAVIIFGVMAVLFRSLRLGLISAVPNLTPLLVTLGYMGLRGFDMNAGNVIVFTISLGIAVDDTIHFLCRFKEERRRWPDDTAEAVTATLRSAGRPILMTSVLIICGLSVLLLSDFVPTRRFAELTMVTMGAALLGELLQLPACLVLFAKPRRATEPEFALLDDAHPALLTESYVVVGASIRTT